MLAADCLELGKLLKKARRSRTKPRAFSILAVEMEPLAQEITTHQVDTLDLGPRRAFKPHLRSPNERLSIMVGKE